MTKTQTKTDKKVRAHRESSVAGRESTDRVVVNDVRLVGKVSAAPVLVELPSGDALVTFRISVPRGSDSGQRVDSIPCTAWASRLRRGILTWRAGDLVEVSGAVRCRFYQAGGATRSRVEVEVTSARITRRSPAA